MISVHKLMAAVDVYVVNTTAAGVSRTWVAAKEVKSQPSHADCHFKCCVENKKGSEVFAR